MVPSSPPQIKTQSLTQVALTLPRSPGRAMRALAPMIANRTLWRILANGRLCYRLPSAPGQRERWVCAVTRAKVCRHGCTMSQIHNRTCRMNPRPRDPWSACDCVDGKGLHTDPSTLSPPPEPPPTYASVLWRDYPVVTLYPTDIRAVEIPGRPKGARVFVDEDGIRRCAHGHMAGRLRAFERERRQQAASILQRWWRRLGSDERLAVRQALVRCAASPPALIVSQELHAAMDAFTACCLERRAFEWRRAVAYKRNGGKPRHPHCGCRAKGLDVRLHATRKRSREDAHGSDTSDGGDASRSPSAARPL